jgi:shikimate dehydrogenase
MGNPYAEVIGDPVAHSLSPLIHKHWLAQLGLEGDYRAMRVAAAELPSYFESRRADPDWRGCNITIPHKEAVLPLSDRVDPGATKIGAANCVAREGERLIARNTDIDGVAAALDSTPIEGRVVTLIGAGGGARAALRYLISRRPARLVILVRDPKKAEKLQSEVAATLEIKPMRECETAVEGSAAIVNASPLGMTGSAAMPPELLACLAANARGCTFFDMVYRPLETPFLTAARANGGIAVDGLTMLVGQARAAFEMFFGRPAPTEETRLRALLIAASSH